MTTNVPFPTFTDQGFVPPTDDAILAGFQADWNAAYQTTFNFGTPTNPTPAGQICATSTAVYSNVCAMFCALANGVDPAFSTGRLQDAIGRLYFMTRRPDKSTVVSCICIGAAPTVIPTGALAQDKDGNIYGCVRGGPIGPTGQTVLSFANLVTGPIPCPAGTLTIIYQTVGGWDTIFNPADGVLGNVVESPSAFETRREESVQVNTVGMNNSILGQVLALPGVLDAYVDDNPNSYPVNKTPQCVITGSISGTTLTVNSVISGEIVVGQSVTGADGLDVGVAAGTTIESGSGTSWVVNNSQTVVATTLNLGGVTLGPNQVYVAVVGGDPQQVAAAIRTKKPPGIPYYPGNTTEIVYDTNVQYPPPGIPYTVVFQDASRNPLPFVVVVNIASSPAVPANATALIQAAVIAAFAGADKGARVKIGSLVLASRFYAGIIALGSWAEIVSLFLGTPNQPNASFTASCGATATSGTATGTSLVISGTSGGIWSTGDLLTGTGIPAGTTIQSQSSGSPGADGTYVMTQAATIAGTAVSGQSSVLDVTVVAAGAITFGNFVFDDGTGNIAEGTTVLSQISGSAGGVGKYQLSQPNFAPSQPMTEVTADETAVQALITQAPSIVQNCIEVNLV